MHARISRVRFKPGTVEDALNIFRTIMLPSASTQKGFKSALIFRNDTDPTQHTIISIWETEADLLASAPPPEILPHLEPLDDLIAEINQETAAMIFQIDAQQK